MSKNRILVTGGAGTIGAALVNALISENNVMCVFDNNEDGLFKLDQEFVNHPHKNNIRTFLGDVRDLERLERAMEGVKQIYHCAALKHVYLSEYNPFDTVKTNLDGVNNVINAAIKQRVEKVVFTSSDKAVNPTSAMGASKLLGERIIIAANGQVGEKGTRFSCVRFGNVLNSKGSVLQIFKKQIENNKPLTITSVNMTRYFITMSEAVDLCIFASENMLGGEIFISNMGATDILSLAKAYCNNDDPEYIVIGEKIGEKLYEELITEEELKRTVKYEDRFVILPDLNAAFLLDTKTLFDKRYSQCKKLTKVMRSDTDLIDFFSLRRLMERVKN